LFWKLQIGRNVLLVLMAYFVISGVCLADSDSEYDNDGRLINSNISAKIAANFPDVTLGTAAIFSATIFTTPTINLRYRVIPLPNKSWVRLATPDYLSVGFGAEHILSSLGWELIPELLTVGGGVSYNTVDESLHGQCNFEFLSF